MKSYIKITNNYLNACIVEEISKKIKLNKFVVADYIKFILENNRLKEIFIRALHTDTSDPFIYYLNGKRKTGIYNISLPYELNDYSLFCILIFHFFNIPCYKYEKYIKKAIKNQICSFSYLNNIQKYLINIQKYNDEFLKNEFVKYVLNKYDNQVLQKIKDTIITLSL